MLLPPDPRYVRGLELFSSGQFYESHDLLEDLWRDIKGELRDYYKSLIQVGAAFHHLKRGRQSAGQKILQTAIAYLSSYPAHTLGLNVEKLIMDLRNTVTVLSALDDGGLKSNPALLNELIPELDFRQDSY